MEYLEFILSIAIIGIILLIIYINGNCEDMAASGSSDNVEGFAVNPSVKTDAVSDWGRGVLDKKENQRWDNLDGNQPYADYNQVMQYTSLEPEIFKSHTEYTQDIDHLNLGPSTLSERSDPNDVIPWRGIRGRPDYQSVYAGRDARQDHSEFPDQMGKKIRHII